MIISIINGDCILSLPVWEEWIEIVPFGIMRRTGGVSSRMGRVD